VAKILVIFLLVLLSFSCRKLEEYPIEPIIVFQNFELLVNTQSGISERGVLTFSYTDGDGDLGLDQGDTLAPYHPQGDYYYNLLISYFEMDHGVFKEIPLLSWNNTTQQYDTLTFNARMPLFLPKDKQQGIKGFVSDTLYVNNPLALSDTIQFKVKIIDRALHTSNEVNSPPIVLIKP
jgi:hypothetical protein